MNVPKGAVSILKRWQRSSECLINKDILCAGNAVVLKNNESRESRILSFRPLTHLYFIGSQTKERKEWGNILKDICGNLILRKKYPEHSTEVSDTPHFYKIPWDSVWAPWSFWFMNNYSRLIFELCYQWMSFSYKGSWFLFWIALDVLLCSVNNLKCSWLWVQKTSIEFA